MENARRSSMDVSGPPTATAMNWPGRNRAAIARGDHGHRVVGVNLPDREHGAADLDLDGILLALGGGHGAPGGRRGRPGGLPRSRAVHRRRQAAASAYSCRDRTPTSPR